MASLLIPRSNNSSPSYNGQLAHTEKQQFITILQWPACSYREATIHHHLTMASLLILRSNNSSPSYNGQLAHTEKQQFITILQWPACSYRGTILGSSFTFIVLSLSLLRAIPTGPEDLLDTDFQPVSPMSLENETAMTTTTSASRVLVIQQRSQRSQRNCEIVRGLGTDPENR